MDKRSCYVNGKDILVFDNWKRALEIQLAFYFKVNHACLSLLVSDWGSLVCYQKSASATLWVSGKAKSGCHRRMMVENVNYGGGRMNEHMRTNN